MSETLPSKVSGPPFGDAGRYMSKWKWIEADTIADAGAPWRNSDEDLEVSLEWANPSGK